MNKSLSWNILFLTGRLLLNLLASLYISKEVLHVLGVTDYGIFTVVNSTVLLMTILTGSFSTAVSRFINVEKGKGNGDRVNSIYTISLLLHIAFSFIILVLLYYFSDFLIYELLTIPKERQTVAETILFISSLNLVWILLGVTFVSLIISNEDMKSYSIIGVIEIFLKLIGVYLLVNIPIEKLVLHMSILSAISFVILLVYIVYCKLRYQRVRLTRNYRLDEVSNLFRFIGWNLVGNISFVVKEHGVNILINVFFGSGVNAAKGLAYQVVSSIQMLFSNVTLATNPRITQLYSSGRQDDALRLALNFTRYMFCFAVLLSVLVIFNRDVFLAYWLDSVPEYTSDFLKLMTLNLLIECISGPLITLLLAIGNIRNYQILVGGVNGLNLPIGYLALNLGYDVYSVFYTSILISLLCFSLRVVLIAKSYSIQITYFLYQFKGVLITLFLVFYWVFYSGLSHGENIDVNYIISLLSIVFSFSLVSFFIVLSRDERISLIKLVFRK